MTPAPATDMDMEPNGIAAETDVPKQTMSDAVEPVDDTAALDVAEPEVEPVDDTAAQDVAEPEVVETDNGDTTEDGASPCTGEDSVVATETDQPTESTAARNTLIEESHPTDAEPGRVGENGNGTLKKRNVSSATESTVETTTSQSLQTVLESGSQLEPISLRRRMCAATGWTIFGLLFFYLVMVGLSTISKNIVLARLPHHGWARTASRQTGSVSTVVFVFFMLSNKSTMFSLVSSVLLACAQFCHFVIVSSDVRGYVDKKILTQMTRTEKTHTLLGKLPLEAMWVLGTVGFFACLVIVNERVYGPALKYRRPELPTISRVCVGWLAGLYSLYYIDNLIWVFGKTSYELGDVLYPLLFLALLFVGGTYRMANRAAIEAVSPGTMPLEAKKNQ